MKYGKLFAKRSSRLTFQSGMAVFLIFQYITGSIGTNLIHEVAHEHRDVELHSEKHEKDPCHRNIYHYEKNACKHQSHITKTEKCLLCQFSVGRDLWVSFNKDINKIFYIEASKNVIVTFHVTDNSIHQPSRAPPAF